MTNAGSAVHPIAAADAPTDHVYVCPMDRDVRSTAPGKCSRCGMELVAGVPEPVEFVLDVTTDPKAPRPDEPVQLTFAVSDPWKNHPVTAFSIVHEKLFHAFIVSRDLQFFEHVHPSLQGSVFRITARLPRPGMYRVLGDFYPEAATPQLLAQTIFVAGHEPPASPLKRDLSPKNGGNLSVALTISPPDPIVGSTTQLRFHLSPADGIERYLGAWGHMLTASDDLVDMIHTHPIIADGSSEMQFKLVFPRSRTYRIWVQFQRQGVINTVHFDVPATTAAPTKDPGPAPSS
jgi:Heavy metal binding domain